MAVQNNETAAMLVYHKSPKGIKLCSHVKTLFYIVADHVSEKRFFSSKKLFKGKAPARGATP